MDDEASRSHKVTPRKSRCQENRGSSSGSCSKKLIRKAKLSLQKTEKRKKVIRKLIAADLNESDDFKTGQTFTGRSCDRNKSDDKQKSHDRDKSHDQHKSDDKLKLGDVHKSDDTRDIKREFIPSDSPHTVAIATASCPACNADFEKKDLKDHVKTCLQQFARFSSTDERVNPCYTAGEELFKQREETHNELILCQLCQKDISHLNSQRRTRHLNQCIDQAEAAKRAAEEERRLLEKAKVLILDCPMCGKLLKTEAMRRSHLKKCAHSLGIPLQQMMQSVKQQDEEHHIQLAAGILPDKLRHRPALKKSGNASKKGVKKVKSKLDEDMQLAIALSSSIADQKVATDHPVTSDAVDRKKNKKVKGRGETPALLLLSKEEVDQRIADKVTALLIPQEEEDITLTPPVLDTQLTQLAAVSVFSSFMHNNKDIMLWGKTDLVVEDPAKVTSLYYTDALMPPVEISSVTAGSKLKRLSDIPGRVISMNSTSRQCKEQNKVVGEQVSSQSELVNLKHEEFDTSPEDLVVSTQTAFVLAELAADSSVVRRHSSELQDLSQASGFCPAEIKVEGSGDVEKNLSRSLLGLVNCPDWSDVTVVANNNVHLYAHKVFLAARCPKLLQMANIDNVIDLTPASDVAVLCVLKYVYSGTVIVNRDCITQVMALAQKLELEEYYKICKDNAEQLGCVQIEDAGSPCSQGGGHSKPVLNCFSSSSDNSDDGSKPGVDAINDDEWKEIYSTQRQKLSVKCSLSSPDNSDEGSKPGVDANDDEWRETQRQKMSSVKCSVSSSDNSDEGSKPGVDANDDEWRETQRQKMSSVKCSVSSSDNSDGGVKLCVDDAINDDECREIYSTQLSVNCSVKPSHEDDRQEDQSSQDKDGFEGDAMNLLKYTDQEKSYSLDPEKSYSLDPEKSFGMDLEKSCSRDPEKSCSKDLEKSSMEHKIQLRATIKPLVGIERDNIEPKASVISSIGIDREKIELKDSIKQSVSMNRKKIETQVSVKPLSGTKQSVDTYRGNVTSHRTSSRQRQETLEQNDDSAEELFSDEEGKDCKQTGHRVEVLQTADYNQTGHRSEVLEMTDYKETGHTSKVLQMADYEQTGHGSEMLETANNNQTGHRFEVLQTDDCNQTEHRSEVLETADYIVYSESSSHSSQITGDCKEAHSKETEECERLYIVSSGESDEEVGSGQQVEHEMSDRQACFSNKALCHPGEDGEKYSHLNPVLSQLANDDSFIDQIDESMTFHQISTVESPHQGDQTSSKSSEQFTNTGRDISASRVLEESRKRKSDTFSFVVENKDRDRISDDSGLKRGKEEPMSKRYKMSTPILSCRTVQHDLNMGEVSKIEYCSPHTTKHEADKPDKGGKSPTANDSLFVTPAVKKYLRSTFMLTTPVTCNQVEKSKLNLDKSENVFMEDDCMKRESKPVCENTATLDKKPVERASSPCCSLTSNTPGMSQDTALSSQADGKTIEFGGDISSDSDIEIVGDNLDIVASQHGHLSPKFSSKTAKHSLTQSQIAHEQDESLIQIECEQDKTQLCIEYEQDKMCTQIEHEQDDSQTACELDVIAVSPHTNHNESLTKHSFTARLSSCDRRTSSSNVQCDIMSGSCSPVADVWEGFDDAAACPVELFADFGAEADVESSPEKKVRSTQKKKHRVSSMSEIDSVTQSRPLPSSQTHGSDTRQQDDVDFFPDDSFILDEQLLMDEEAQVKTTVTESQFKTPKTKRTGRKKWIPPSPFTPMADYDNMVTPNLKKAVEMFGLKPLCKKRMKLVLKDIYQQTHQYETDSDYEPDTDRQNLQATQDSPAKSSPVKSSSVFRSSQVIKTAWATSKVIKSKASSKRLKKTDSTATQQSKKQSTITKMTIQQKGKPHREVKHDVPHKTVSLQSEECSVSSSQESTCSDMPEESFMIDDDISASQQTGKPELHAQLMKFVMDNPEIHAKILVYEPLELDWLKLKLTEAGIKCSIQKLMDFLDEKCITFTMKKMNKRNTRRKPARRKKVLKVL